MAIPLPVRTLAAIRQEQEADLTVLAEWATTEPDGPGKLLVLVEDEISFRSLLYQETQKGWYCRERHRSAARQRAFSLAANIAKLEQLRLKVP